ncbi:MAG TPA: polysaccharide biosynthesis/export family protein [Gemmataceae bacterium]|nr:polysaccharide biosynthesis/export family protein [Gemmataceae bacterium]
MPPRTPIRFLVGFAAFLGACTGGAGCQTSSVESDAFFARTVAGAGRSPAPATGQPAAAEGVIASSASGMAAARPAATIGPAICVWQPAQHVAAGTMPAPGDIARVSNPPAPNGVMRPSIDIPPQPLAIAGAAPPGEPAAQPLPPPHLEPQPVVGEPELPAMHPSAPHEFAKQPLPPYIVEPPDILLISLLHDLADPAQDVQGPHLVRPDGSVSLGIYGNVYLAGRTLDEARDAVAAQLHVRLDKKSIEDIKKGLVVDVIAYNSKVYYVITDGGGYGQQIYPIPITGNETVLDALSKIGGLPPVASKNRIWVARATADCDHPILLPVDWCGVTQRGCVTTDYQIFPNDRIYVASDKWIVASTWFRKRLDIPQQILGVTLLGSSTVNSIRNRTGTTAP